MKVLYKRFRKSEQGFTLIELLAVIAILGLLAVLVVPRVQASIEEARLKAALSSAASLQLAMERYSIDNGNDGYPATESITGYSTLREVLKDYTRLPANENGANFTFSSYTSTGDTYELIITAKDQDSTMITITQDGITY
mgnify:CR=1 FL=1